MIEQAYLSVWVRKVGRRESVVAFSLIDGQEIELQVNNHKLLTVEGNPHRARLMIECTGAVGIIDPEGGVPVGGKVSVNLPSPHINHGHRVTVASKFVDRPNPSETIMAYDTRTFDVKAKEERKGKGVVQDN